MLLAAVESAMYMLNDTAVAVREEAARVGGQAVCLLCQVAQLCQNVCLLCQVAQLRNTLHVQQVWWCCVPAYLHMRLSGVRCKVYVRLAEYKPHMHLQWAKCMLNTLLKDWD